MDILSTRSVAGVLGVSEATVKRWADAGTLRCFRTPGGHRKFRLRDVKAFLADQQGGGESAEPPAAPPLTPLDPEQAEARALALASDVDALVSVVAHQRLKGLSLTHTFDRVLTPALHDIAEGRASGKVSPAQERVASNTVGLMLARVRPLVEPTPRADRGRALCACLGDEPDDVAVRMVALVLASEGYVTGTVAANVTAGDLALMIAGNPPALVALSAARSASGDNLRGDLGVVASAASAVKTRILVGGAAFARLPSLPNQVRRYASLEELVTVALKR